MGDLFTKVEAKEEITTDDGQYVLDFLESNCKEFKMHFCQYTPAMMAQVYQ